MAEPGNTEQPGSTAVGTAIAVEEVSDNFENPAPRLKEVLGKAKSNPDFKGSELIDTWVNHIIRVLPTDPGSLGDVSPKEKGEFLEPYIQDGTIPTGLSLFGRDRSGSVVYPVRGEKILFFPDSKVYMQDTVPLLKELGVIGENVPDRAPEQYRNFETKWLAGILDPDLLKAIDEEANQSVVLEKGWGKSGKKIHEVEDEKGIVEIQKSTNISGVDIVVGFRGHKLASGGQGAAGVPSIASLRLEFTPAALVAAITAPQSPNQ